MTFDSFLQWTHVCVTRPPVRCFMCQVWPGIFYQFPSHLAAALEQDCRCHMKPCRKCLCCGVFSRNCYSTLLSCHVSCSEVPACTCASASVMSAGAALRQLLQKREQEFDQRFAKTFGQLSKEGLPTGASLISCCVLSSAMRFSIQ